MPLQHCAQLHVLCYASPGARCLVNCSLPDRDSCHPVIDELFFVASAACVVCVGWKELMLGTQVVP